VNQGETREKGIEQFRDAIHRILSNREDSLKIDPARVSVNPRSNSSAPSSAKNNQILIGPALHKSAPMSR